MTAELIALLVPEAINLVKSGVQATQAKKLEQQYKRPNYDISSGYEGALNVSKEMASNSNIPGFENIMREIRDSGADAAYRATELGDPNGAVYSAGLNQENIADLMAKIGVSGAQLQNQNKQNYVQQLGLYGAKQDTAFQINEMAPYEAAKAAEAALRGAAFKNLESGVQGITNAYMMDKQVLNPGEYGKTKQPKYSTTGINGNVSPTYNTPFDIEAAINDVKNTSYGYND